jgi:hypothetical protein
MLLAAGAFKIVPSASRILIAKIRRRTLGAPPAGVGASSARTFPIEVVPMTAMWTARVGRHAALCSTVRRRSLAILCAVLGFGVMDWAPLWAQPIPAVPIAIVPSIGHYETIDSVALAPDGRFVLSSGQGADLHESLFPGSSQET